MLGIGLTSTSFTLLSNRRLQRLTAIAVLLRSASQICLQGPRVLQVTLARMCSQYRALYLRVVRTIGQTLAVIDLALFRALVNEVFGPTKQQNASCEEYCELFRNSAL
jgi:hypothetical protein